MGSNLPSPGRLVFVVQKGVQRFRTGAALYCWAAVLFGPADRGLGCWAGHGRRQSWRGARPLVELGAQGDGNVDDWLQDF